MAVNVSPYKGPYWLFYRTLEDAAEGELGRITTTLIIIWVNAILATNL
jgi:hypothetical protein